MFPWPREHGLLEGPLTEEKQRDQATPRCPGLPASAPHSTGWATFSAASWPLHEEEARPAEPRSQPASGSPALCSCIGRRRWEACCTVRSGSGASLEVPGGSTAPGLPLHGGASGPASPRAPPGPSGSCWLFLCRSGPRKV